MSHPIARRSALRLLAGAAAGSALASIPSAPASAQFGPPPAVPFGGLPTSDSRAVPAGLRYASVEADTSRIARLGAPGPAELLGQDLRRQLRIVFADLIGADRRGATLLVRVNSLYLGAYSGGRSGGSLGVGPDNIDGVGLVVSGGRLLSQTPIYTTLDPAYSGAWYLPDIDRLRIDSISHQLAYWLRREMGV